MVKRKPIPVLVLTGFLGAGKTTLLAGWLRAPQFSAAMVIVNELGEVGLDDALVQHSSDAPLLLENGCACCTAAEDLNATLERLFWDRLHRRIEPFDWVLIETTGVADPGAVLAAMTVNPVVRERYGPVTIVSVFDVVQGPDQLLRHSECRAQLLHANIVILSKMDLASDQQISQARELIATHNPQASLLSSQAGNLSDSMDVNLAGEIAACARNGGVQLQDISGGASRLSARFAHGAGISSAFLATEHAFTRDGWQQKLQDFVMAHENLLLRLKGLVALPDNSLAAVQWTPGAPVAITDLHSEAESTLAQRRCGLTLMANNDDGKDSNLIQAQILCAALDDRLAGKKTFSIAESDNARRAPFLAG